MLCPAARARRHPHIAAMHGASGTTDPAPTSPADEPCIGVAPVDAGAPWRSLRCTVHSRPSLTTSDLRRAPPLHRDARCIRTFALRPPTPADEPCIGIVPVDAGTPWWSITMHGALTGLG